MCRHKKVFLSAAIAICVLIAGFTVWHFVSADSYPGMIRISSQTERGIKTSNDHIIELPGLKAGQLVVLDIGNCSGVTGSWVRHSSTETFVLETRPFTDGKLEYEVLEDADYTFQLICRDAQFDLAISVWDQKK